jgi:hypothetical protein
LHSVGDPVGPLLHKYRVGVNDHHFATEPLQLTCRGSAKPTETNYEHGSVVANSLNQRWAFLRADETVVGADWRQGPRRG